jgi:hypothetical protein
MQNEQYLASGVAPHTVAEIWAFKKLKPKPWPGVKIFTGFSAKLTSNKFRKRLWETYLPG